MRRFITQKRDWWYDYCRDKYRADRARVAQIEEQILDLLAMHIEQAVLLHQTLKLLGLEHLAEPATDDR